MPANLLHELIVATVLVAATVVIHLVGLDLLMRLTGLHLRRFLSAWLNLNRLLVPPGLVLGLFIMLESLVILGAFIPATPMLVLTGGLLATGVLALLLPWRAIMAPRGERPAPKHGEKAARPLRAAFAQRRFWLLAQVMFFTGLGMYLVLPQSVTYLIDVGFTPLQSATAVGAASMLSVAGVSTSGFLSDRFSHKHAATVSFIGTALGIGALYALTYRKSGALLAAYVLLFGICQGARGPLVASLSAKLFSGRGQATVYGAIYALMSVGIGLGALLSGALYDWTGGYRAAFLLALVCVALAAAPFWLSQDQLVPKPSPQLPEAARPSP